MRVSKIMLRPLPQPLVCNESKENKCKEKFPSDFNRADECVQDFQEIDELCEEWAPEPLIPSITDDMKREPPVLERWECCFSFLLLNTDGCILLGLIKKSCILFR